MEDEESNLGKTSEERNLHKLMKTKIQQHHLKVEATRHGEEELEPWVKNDSGRRRRSWKKLEL
jgi:hypothetical protein